MVRHYESQFMGKLSQRMLVYIESSTAIAISQFKIPLLLIHIYFVLLMHNKWINHLQSLS